MMLGSKAPNYDAHGLRRVASPLGFRATHLRFTSVVAKRVPLALSNPQSYPIFAYRGMYIPLLCSYRGGFQGLPPLMSKLTWIQTF